MVCDYWNITLCICIVYYNCVHGEKHNKQEYKSAFSVQRILLYNVLPSSACAL